MVEAVLWVSGSALIALALMVCFTAWLRFLDDDAETRHNLKHRCPDKWRGEIK